MKRLLAFAHSLAEHYFNLSDESTSSLVVKLPGALLDGNVDKAMGRKR